MSNQEHSPSESEKEPRPPAPRTAAAPPPAPSAPPRPEGEQPAGEELAAQQLAALRSRNRLLKFILTALIVIVLLIAGAAAFLYNRIAPFFPSAEMYQSGTMENFASDPAAAMRALPAFAKPSGEAGGQGQSSLFLVKVPGGGGSPGGAGAGAVQIQVPQVPRLSKEEAAAMNAAMSRYAEHPLVKEFLDDLRRDPVVGEAFMQGKQPTPADFMKVISHPASVQRITMKYAGRPGFMALMMEVMNDPAFRPVLGGRQDSLPPVPAP